VRGEAGLPGEPAWEHKITDCAAGTCIKVRRTARKVPPLPPPRKVVMPWASVILFSINAAAILLVTLSAKKSGVEDVASITAVFFIMQVIAMFLTC